MKDSGISQREIDLIIKNESKWREYMIQKIENIEKNQADMVVTVTTLKIKIGLISGCFGAIAGIVSTIIAKKIGG